MTRWAARLLAVWAGGAGALVFVGVLVSTPGGNAETGTASWSWDLPPGFPEPPVPADNPMSSAKVELGRRLFYDGRLSVDGTYACASCHRQEQAFTDGRALARGVTGELHPRSTPTLTNVAYQATLQWADPELTRLEAQVAGPLFSHRPVELGMEGREGELLRRLRDDPLYRRLFAEAFPGGEDAPRISLETLAQALAAFERTLISSGSAWDRWIFGGDPEAMSAAARRGLELFESPRLGCSGCHVGFNVSAPVHRAGALTAVPPMFNVGLYDVDGKGGYPAVDTGLHRKTGRPEDMGRFRVPTLRNVEITAPYMHDGSLPTLEAVIDHYAAGGRVIRSGLQAGDGRANPFKDPRIRGFSITAEERGDLIAFLESLTDPGFVRDPRFSDPWGSSGESTGAAPRGPGASSPDRGDPGSP